MTGIARRRADALRMLAVDAIEQAKSGHPGVPMGMADIAEVLWTHYLRHDPSDPLWPDRDRFVLSNGHASMLLYGLLHLTGYDLPVSELKRFRQLHSRAPGHPEFGLTPGVEVTTGPLGQGLANAVGMALAEKLLASQFNRPDFPIIDHRTWVFAGDGCLMEGISHEACSLAGTLRLSKLTVLYDENGISIDGRVQSWFTDDTAARFRSYGWHVITPVDGHNPAAVDAALREACDQRRPTLVCCRTQIGQGSPNRAGTEAVHGAPLGAEEVALTRRTLEWPHPPFEIPADVRESWDARKAGAIAHSRWTTLCSEYELAHSQAAAELRRRLRGDLPSTYLERAAQMERMQGLSRPAIATRTASQQALEMLGPRLPELLGGAADLTALTLTSFTGARSVEPEGPGRYLNYGAREFGMAAVMNGLALHGGFIPYGGTFLALSDYSRSALRMAALMRLRVIHVFTHDSIGVGEDGPTHQPVEQASSLRMIPNLDVWRPADALETAVAWRCAIERTNGPTALLLSRQKTTPLPAPPGDIACGGYVVRDIGHLKVILLATGSEVGLALEAQKLLTRRGIGSRVVSMPCTQAFDRQPPAWRLRVLVPGLPIVAVEAGHPDFWRKYVGHRGAVVGINGFGASAPAPDLYRFFDLTAAKVAAAAEPLVCVRNPIHERSEDELQIERSNN